MATQTTNYHFPKYEADDLPNLLDEYNEFADLADAAINNAMMTATNAGTAAQNASTKADAAGAKVDTVEDDVNTLSGQVTTAQNTAEQALSLAQTNESGITELEGQMETANTAISSLQSGKAPTMHASSTTQYGSGTATNYGHVRLSDTPSQSSATSGTAATPKAVSDSAAQTLADVIERNEIVLTPPSGFTPSAAIPTPKAFVYPNLKMFKFVFTYEGVFGPSDHPQIATCEQLGIPAPATTRYLLNAATTIKDFGTGQATPLLIHLVVNPDGTILAYPGLAANTNNIDTLQFLIDYSDFGGE